MSRRKFIDMKRINITTAILSIYVIVMGVLYWPGSNPTIDYPSYFIVLGGTAFITVVLRIIQIRRLKLREQWKKELEDKASNNE